MLLRLRPTLTSSIVSALVVAAMVPSSHAALDEPDLTLSASQTRARAGSPRYPAGPIVTAVILVTFPDYPGLPFTPSEAGSFVFGATASLNAYIQSMSYGRNHVSGTTFGWFTLPHPSPHYCPGGVDAATGLRFACNVDLYVPDALALAANAGYAPANFARTVFVLNGSYIAGGAGVGGPHFWVSANRGFDLPSMAHELGHTLGAWHAGSMFNCPNGPPDALDVHADCTVVRYGDFWEVMAAGTQHSFSAYHKSVVGFLPPSRTVVAGTTNATYELAPLALPSMGFQELRIPVGGPSFYTLEYRRPIGYDTAPNPLGDPAPEGVVVRLRFDTVPGVSDNDHALLPGIVRPGAAFTDPFRGFTVSVSSLTPDKATVVLDQGWADGDRIPGPTSTTVVDPTRRAGSDNATVVDADCTPHVVYVGGPKGRTLHHATRAPDGTWTRSDVDLAGRVGEFLSVAADADGGLHAAYHRADGAFRDLKYAYRPAGGSWMTETVDAVGRTGLYTSTAVGPDGTVFIAYHDRTLGDLRLASRPPNGGWQLETIDGINRVGTYAALAVASSGRVYVVYVDASTLRRRLATGFRGGPWTREDVAAASNRNGATAIALDAAETLHVAYADVATRRLHYARRTLGGTWAREMVDPAPTVGNDLALAASSDGAPVYVVYGDASFDLHLATRNAAGGWTFASIDDEQSKLRSPSLALGCGDAAGLHVGYYDDKRRQLNVAHATFDYTVAVGPENALALVGDLNGDGIYSVPFEYLRMGKFADGDAVPTADELTRADGDGDGVVTIADLMLAGSHCVIHPTARSRSLYRIGDLDRDGTVTRRELARAGKHAQQLGGNDPQERTLLDANRDGTIGVTDVSIVLANHQGKKPIACVAP